MFTILNKSLNIIVYHQLMLSDNLISCGISDTCQIVYIVLIRT